ncbi:rhomboid family intramembrane serine protease [Weissella sagaensis]|uniref:Rhomboid family intramembrane serine protease n=1 Tax=Weissella sagaensis TaxID=2559928 RepID=A0ABW1RU76_9LACO|nr:rhomboid family intramembrane serine protease [Weissella sagaensis]QDJ59292.1 rhomboid family intramembrane serine protease [Weissella hellenica]QEA56604.1 rhomboid family intramembrane serine protease [Weissella hellenica]UEG67415.1 rhomboid family intramembrane serine protease [Weissella hellenica]
MNNFKHAWRQAPVTVSLVAIMVVVFGVEIIISQQINIMAPVLYKMGALFTPAVILFGEWWRLLTAGFLHVTLMHLVLNMITLYYLGRLLEQYVGSIKFILSYVLALLTGSLTSMAFGSANTISAGASGAIFGLFGMIFVLGLLDNGGYWLYQAKTLSIFVILSLLPVFWGSNIAITAHIGGLVSGFLLTPMFLKEHATNKQRLVGTTVWFFYIVILLMKIFNR